MSNCARNITSKTESEELQKHDLSESDIELVKEIVSTATKFWNYYIQPKHSIQVSVGCTYILYNFFAVAYRTESNNSEVNTWKIEFNVVELKEYLRKIKENVWDNKYTGEEVLTAIVIHEISHALGIGGVEFQYKFNEEKIFKSNGFTISFFDYLLNIFKPKFNRISFLDRLKYRYYIALIFFKIPNYKSRKLAMELKLDHDRQHVIGSLLGELEETEHHIHDLTENNRMTIYDRDFALIVSLGNQLNNINIFTPITIKEIVEKFK